MITDKEFMALFPLYQLAKQRAENRNPNFDWSMSRDDFLNGRNGIPQAAGMKIVFSLLLLSNGDKVEISPDQQSFRITLAGVEAVLEYAAANQGGQVPQVASK